MFDSKMLIVVLLIALVIFGTKRLRSIGSDLGAAVKGFKQAMNDGESAEQVKQLKQDADFDTSAVPGAAAPAAREATPDAACLISVFRKFSSPRPSHSWCWGPSDYRRLPVKWAAGWAVPVPWRGN
jgi:sec-independent protein translocase protein TatA